MLCPAPIFEVLCIFSLGNSYGAVSNNHIHLRIELSTECKENPKQLMKVYVQHLTESAYITITFPSFVG